MRRAFTLQMYSGSYSCESPGDCGKTCHCGESVYNHPIADPYHSPVPMVCWACKLELDPLDVLEEP